MNIFKLFGSIFVDSSEAEKSISSTDKKANNLAESFLSGAKTVGKWGAVIGTAAATAAIAIGSLAVNTSDAAQKAIKSFAAETGTATEQLGEYEDVMKSIYKNNFGESFEDVAQAMAQVKQQAGDIGADEIESLTTDAIMLRDTFEFEVNESMRAAKMMMDQFGMSGEEAYNLIAQGAQSGLDKNGDLLDSINEYSVHFKQLGLGAEEMLNMLANGSAAGTFSVDKLGDAIKEFGIRVKDGSDGSRAAFEYLGYDADALFQTFNEGGEEAAAMTQILIDELASMPDSVEKTTAGVALFGTMWEDLGSEGVKALSELDGAISTTNDALNQINSVKYNSIGEAFEGLKRQVETSVVLPLGEKLIPVVGFVIEKLANMGDITQKVGKWIEDIGIDVHGVAGIISDFAQSAIPAFQGVWDFCKTIWETIGFPIWDAILFATLLVKDTFMQYMPEINEFVSQAVAGISESWEYHLKPCLEAIGNFLDKTLKPIFEKVFKLFIVPLVKEVFGAIKIAWETVLKPVFNGICDFITGVFTGNWKKAFEGIVEIVKGAVNAVIGGFEFMVNNAISSINKILSGISTIASAVGSVIGLEPISLSLDRISLPRLWKGGVLEKGQMGLLEGDGAEAVVPLENNHKWISAVANDMESAGIGGNSETLDVLKKILALLENIPEELLDAIASMKFDIDNREFARLVKAVT